MSGVYQIYNTETNKRYIGSSIDVQRRLKEHLRNLKANRHCNQHLQNAWNRYGYQIPRFTDMPEDKKVLLKDILILIIDQKVYI